MQWSLPEVATSVALVGSGSSSGGHTVGCYGGMSHQRSVVRLTVWVYSFLSERRKESRDSFEGLRPWCIRIGFVDIETYERPNG